MYAIPNEGSAAVGCHTVLKSISTIPTFIKAGAPDIIIYIVIAATAITANMAQTKNIISIIVSIRAFEPLLPFIEKPLFPVFMPVTFVFLFTGITASVSCIVLHSLLYFADIKPTLLTIC